jgi:hypothetical protein
VGGTGAKDQAGGPKSRVNLVRPAPGMEVDAHADLLQVLVVA